MYCEKCKVTVRGNYTRCPLCQQTLTGHPVEGVFPHIAPPATRLKGFLRFAAFFCITSVVICVALNVMFPDNGWWSLFVIAGMGSLWLSVGLLLRKRENLHKAIIWQVALITILALVWDLFTGFLGWSLEYVFPILCTAAMLFMAIVAQATRLRIEDYLIYLVIDGLWGLLCIALIALDAVQFVLPALICIGCSIISLAALLIFEGRALRTELRRRMHL